MSHFVYVIAPSLSSIEAPYHDSYVGVTNNVKRRWQEHARNDYFIGHMIRRNDWKFASNMEIILSAPQDECFALERQLRPLPGIGLNVLSGGKGGFTNRLLAGSRQTLQHDQDPHNGEWLLKDPQGTVYETNTLTTFCEAFDLRTSILWKYLGRKVPAFHNYRQYTPPADFKRQRDKTTGWTLVPAKTQSANT